VVIARLSATAVAPGAFVGRWALQRRLHDRRSGRFGRASGVLTVSADDLGTRWDEQGRLTLGDYSAEFTRTLFGRQIDGEWWMTFEDGRPFHPWRPGLQVEHPCRDDLYRGGVWISDLNNLRVWWDVSGPRKSQRIFTRLTRVLSA
jgi:hypothetical protein